MALGEGGDHGAATLPLIADQAKHGGGGGIVRSGSMWTAAAHVITAVIGSGVLSLAWSIAQLGWVAGPAAMLVFAAVTALQSTLFADCYRSPDPEHGPHRNRTYAKAVDRNLGSSSSWMCMLLQHTALFGYGIAYTITASISCRYAACILFYQDMFARVLLLSETRDHHVERVILWWGRNVAGPPHVARLGRRYDNACAISEQRVAARAGGLYFIDAPDPERSGAMGRSHHGPKAGVP